MPRARHRQRRMPSLLAHMIAAASAAANGITTCRARKRRCGASSFPRTAVARDIDKMKEELMAMAANANRNTNPKERLDPMVAGGVRAAIARSSYTQSLICPS